MVLELFLLRVLPQLLQVSDRLKDPGYVPFVEKLVEIASANLDLFQKICLLHAFNDSVFSEPGQANLTHDRNPIRANLIQNSDLTRLAVGIFLFPQIFLSQKVDVAVGPLLRYLFHFAAHGEVAIRVIGICDRNGHFSVAPHIFVFDAPLSRVDSDMLSIVVAPDGRHVGATIRHQSPKMGEGSPRKEIPILFWNRHRHTIPSLTKVLFQLTEIIQEIVRLRRH